jgi:toxin-antitoxin system PIN domain toxin
VIAVDTNILVYAHREDSTWHDAAYRCIEELATGRDAWAIPWPCLHEFLAVVTHPRIYAPPTPLERALDQAQAWLESPSVVLLCEAEDHWQKLQALLRSGRASGPKVHDARIAALCIANEIAELWTADRDFSRFPVLRIRNPLVG